MEQGNGGCVKGIGESGHMPGILTEFKQSINQYMYVHMCEGHVKQLFLRSFASTDSIYQQSHLVKLWPLHLRLTKTKEWHTSSKDMAVCYRWDTHSVLTATPSPTAICLVRNINNIQLYAPHPTQQTSWIHTRPGRKAVKPSCKTSDAVEHSQHFHLVPLSYFSQL